MGVFLKSATGLALESGVSFLRIVAPFYFVVASKLVSDGVLRGSGQMKQFMCATFSDLILRIVFAVERGACRRSGFAPWHRGICRSAPQLLFAFPSHIKFFFQVQHAPNFRVAVFQIK